MNTLPEDDEDELAEDQDDGDVDHDCDDDSEIQFANPGGRSALRAETPDNPRNLPCPTCHRRDMLTPADVAQGYQCDRCADVAEG